MTEVKVTPETSEPNFRETEAAFERSLGSDFGTASIIEEEQTSEEGQPAERPRRSVFNTMRSISVRDHRVAGLLAVSLGEFGMHKFYLGYHEQGFILLLATILIGTLTLGIGVIAVWVFALIEGLNYFSFSQPEFERVYVEGTQDWF